MTTSKSTFSQNLLQIRAKLGYSQSEMARLVGESKSTYANWENNREPSYEKLLKVAKTLNIEVTELLLPKKDELSYERCCTFLKEHGNLAVTLNELDDEVTISSLSDPDDYTELIMPKDHMIFKVEYIQQRGNEARSRTFKDYTKDYFRLQKK
jgi:Predicted transcriptional regulators